VYVVCWEEVIGFDIDGSVELGCVVIVILVLYWFFCNRKEKRG